MVLSLAAFWVVFGAAPYVGDDSEFFNSSPASIFHARVCPGDEAET
ncbi:MAG: hypothetical protein M3256_26820 [Actinomycetota bacterium]|nr:hypothetical protein [Actinomycetota bacterium]